jgi:hypothetical protein
VTLNFKLSHYPILKALDVTSPSSDNRKRRQRMLQKRAMMMRLPPMLHSIEQLVCTLLTLLIDVVRYCGLCFRAPTALVAENLFLRKQLALYQERCVKPRRATTATRVALSVFSRWFDWRQALVIV